MHTLSVHLSPLALTVFGYSGLVRVLSEPWSPYLVLAHPHFLLLLVQAFLVQRLGRLLILIGELRPRGRKEPRQTRRQFWLPKV